LKISYYLAKLEATRQHALIFPLV